ncbi:MAG: CotH kinase family protein [Salinivirgaceae bacterium]|jgi:hypothetical protein|nr:CotH kinase family protein [Salinivirgaceae bacterium]
MSQNYKRQSITVIILSIFIGFSASAQINFPYGSSFKYLKGSDAISLGSNWVNSDFDDSIWETAAAPFRYGDGTGGTELTDMQGSYSTIFLRTTFTASQVNLIENVMVNANWDDGFVMFVNGSEVLSRQAPDIISYDALSSGLHEYGDVETISLSASAINLVEGENTLAIFACNTSLDGSSDFYIDVNLLAGIVQPDLPELIDTVGVSFDRSSGFYLANFTLNITSPDPTAQVIYTLDGSNPQTSFTSIKGNASAQVVIDPTSKANRGTTPGVVVRASLVKDGFKPSKPSVRSFIYLENIKTQSYPGWDWPSYDINGQWIDLDIDTDIINSDEYKDKIEEAFLDIPTISVITDNANLFDPSKGIYVNAMLQGREWERECSVELINPDGSEGFNVNAGLRIRGGWSRHENYPKHAFRLFFRTEYGDSKLYFPLFGDEGVDHFDKVDLRCAQNYGWNNGSGQYNTFLREVFLRDAQGETGSPYTRSRYYHLYLNGLYWGLFQTQERSEARFASDYLGGANEKWDILKKGGVDDGTIIATDGNRNKWRELWDITTSGFSSNANYFKLEGKDANGNPMKGSELLVDIDNLIDYMINIFYGGNFDSPVSAFGDNSGPNNIYMIKNRENKTQGFQFLIHDAEHALLYEPVGPGNGIDENRVNLDKHGMTNPGFDRFHPGWLHHRLSSNEEYRVRFADLAMKRLTNGGIFTEDADIVRMDNRAEMIDMAIIAESARWGDTHKDPAYTKADWEKEINVLRNNYFPRREAIVIGQLLDYDLFPSIDAPKITFDGDEVLNDIVFVTSNSTVGFTASSGEIYYSIDGTDPRALGGDVSPTAIKIESGETISISASAVIKVRAVSGDEWSGLCSVDFIADQHDFLKFKVTELHYHPSDSIIGTDTIEASNYEFIEFKNTSYTSAINLSGVVIDSAINFEFAENTLLPPQQYFIVAAKPKKFYDRYGMLATGNFSKSFSNGGEQVLITDKFGDVVMDFTYFDEEPWLIAPDGDGPSLVSVEGNPTGDPSDYYYWAASGNTHGSPKHNDLISGIEDDKTVETLAGAFRLYPNPTNDEFKLLYSGNNDSQFEVKLYDVKGTLLFVNSYYNKAAISLNDLGIDFGVYMVSIESNNQIETRKVVYAPF